MKIKDLTEVGLLLAIGFVLHSLCPPILLGMKPDFSLAMLFSIILLKRDFKLALIAGLATGIFTALTTGFPGGQIANLVDKTLTTTLIVVIINTLNIRKNIILVGLVNGIGTIISGLIFLTTAAIIIGLPGPMMTLILTVVLPAALINTFAGTILFTTIVQSKKFIEQTQ